MKFKDRNIRALAEMVVGDADCFPGGRRFLAKSFDGSYPQGEVTYHEAFGAQG